jgi:hypothetical protein
LEVTSRLEGPAAEDADIIANCAQRKCRRGPLRRTREERRRKSRELREDEGGISVVLLTNLGNKTDERDSGKGWRRKERGQREEKKSTLYRRGRPRLGEFLKGQGSRRGGGHRTGLACV